MPKLKPTFIWALTIILSGTCILLINIQKGGTPQYQLLPIVVPREKSDAPNWSLNLLLNQLKGKKLIKVILDEDHYTNQKKLHFIRFEARKLKYTRDSSTVIDIRLTNEVYYGEIIQLLKICEADQHRTFALLNGRFIIFGEYPSRPKDTTAIIIPGSDI